MASQSSFPYVGSRISLISNIGIRYEGVLYSINTKESTIVLQHVKSHGTENRKLGASQPARDEVYDFVVFKGKDIQDLTVLEPPAGVLDDPAIVAINQHAAPHVGGEVSGPVMGDGGMHGDKVGMRGASPGGFPPHRGGPSFMGPPGGMFHESLMPGNVMGAPWPRYNAGFPPRRGGYNFRGGRGGGSRRILGELPAQLNEAVKSQVQEAFDFEGANAKFDKNTVNADGAGESKAIPNVQSGYDKASSFFDCISCETLDREHGVDSRVDRDKQRQVDLETFGPAAAVMNRAPRFRRGFRRGLGMKRGRGGMMQGPMYPRVVPPVGAGGGHFEYHAHGYPRF